MPAPWAYHVVPMSAVLATGEKVEWQLRAYVYDDTAAVNLNYLVDRFFEQRKSRQSWKHIWQARPRWRSLAEQLGHEWAKEYLASARIVRRAQLCGDEKTRSCQTVTLQLLMMILADWACSSYQQRWRQKGAAMLQSLFEELVSKDVCTPGLLLLRWEEVGFGGCDCVNHKTCAHNARRDLEACFDEATCPQQGASRMMLGLLKLVPSCSFARKLFREYSMKLRDDMMRTLVDEAKGLTPGHKVVPDQRKRKVTEDTYRFEVMVGLKRAGRGRHGKAQLRADNYHRSTHVSWAKKEIAGYVQCCHRVMGKEAKREHPELSVLISEDATRLGNPAKETLLMVATSSASRTSAVMAPQVLPDWRGQQTVASKLNWEDNGERWRLRVRNFLQRKRSEEVAEAQQARRLSLAVSELANWHSVLALDSSLRASFGLGLEDFRPRKRLRPLEPGEERRWLPRERWPREVAAASGERTRRACVCRPGEAVALEATWGGPRGTLHVCLDQGAVGWPARGWLLHGPVGLRGSRQWDVPHRRHNNVANALVAAELQTLRAEALVLLNVASGPWSDHGNYSRWLGAAAEFVQNAGPQDPLFTALLPWMLHCVQEGKVTHIDEDAAAEVFSKLRHVATTASRGEMVQLNRWFQLWSRLRSFLPLWGFHLILNLHQCLTRGWYTSISELGIVVPKEVEAGGSEDQVLGIAEGGVHEGLGEAPRPVRRSHQGLTALRSRCQTTQHLATEILSSWASRSIFVGLATCVKPVEERHAKEVTIAKTRRGRRELNMMRSMGQDWAYVVQTLEAFENPGTLYNMGVEPYDKDVCVTLLDESKTQLLLSHLLRFWRALVAKEVNMLRHFAVVPPKAFLRMLHPDPVVRDATLGFMKDLFEKLEVFEKNIAGAALRAELRALEWPLEQWTRELLLSAAECEFRQLPETQLRELEFWGESMAGSKIVEDLFNECRSFEKDSKNQQLGTPGVWLACLHADVLRDSGVDPINSTEVDKLDAEKIPKVVYDAKKSEPDMSLAGGEELKKAFLGKTDKVPRHSVAKHMEISYATQAMLDVDDVHQWSRSWMSLLAEPGFVMYSALDESRRGYIVDSNKFGVLLWRGEAVGVPGFQYWVFQKDGNPFYQVTVTDPDEYRLLRCTPRTPTWVATQSAMATLDVVRPQGVVLQLEGLTAPKLLEHSAWHAFRGLPYLQMSQLHSWLGVEGPKPALVGDMCVKLVVAVLHISEEGAAKIVEEHRAAAAKGKQWDSVVLDNQELVEELVKEPFTFSWVVVLLCFARWHSRAGGRC